jgi:hypothetical protein
MTESDTYYELLPLAAGIGRQDGALGQPSNTLYRITSARDDLTEAEVAQLNAAYWRAYNRSVAFLAALD